MKRIKIKKATLLCSVFTLSACKQAYDLQPLEKSFNPDESNELYNHRQVVIDPKVDQSNHEFDVLLVIDNSYSMTPAHENLARGISSISEKLRGRNVNVKLFTTSDASHATSSSSENASKDLLKLTTTINAGEWTHSSEKSAEKEGRADGSLPRPYTDHLSQKRELTSGYTLEEIQFREDMHPAEFNRMRDSLVQSIVDLGDKGNAVEKGFNTLGHILLQGNVENRVLKKGGKAAVIFVSDEDDQSPDLREANSCSYKENVTVRNDYLQFTKTDPGSPERWFYTARILPKKKKIRVSFESEVKTKKDPVYVDGVLVDYRESTYRSTFHTTGYSYIEIDQSPENILNCRNSWNRGTGESFISHYYNTYMPQDRKSSIKLKDVGRVSVQCMSLNPISCSMSLTEEGGQCSSNSAVAQGSGLFKQCEAYAKSYYGGYYEFDTDYGCRSSHVEAIPEKEVDASKQTCDLENTIQLVQALSSDAETMEEALIQKLHEEYGDGDLHLSAIVNRKDPKANENNREFDCSSESSKEGARFKTLVASHLKENPKLGSVHPICSDDYSAVLGDNENGIVRWIEKTVQTEFKIQKDEFLEGEKIEAVSILRAGAELQLERGKDYNAKGLSLKILDEALLEDNDKLKVELISR